MVGRFRRRTNDRRFFRRRKVCAFCVDKVAVIDFKDVPRLRRYISDWAKIEPRRKSGTCAPHQRALANAIKRARQAGLLPFTGSHSLMDLARPEPFRGDRDRYRTGRDRYGASQPEAAPAATIEEVPSPDVVAELPQSDNVNEGEGSSSTESAVADDSLVVDSTPVAVEASSEPNEVISESESSEAIEGEDSVDSQELEAAPKPTKRKSTKA